MPNDSKNKMFVLVLGHRKKVFASLKKLNVPYMLWTEEDSSSPEGAVMHIVAPFKESTEYLLSTLKPAINGKRSITHVIATTEGTVYIASLLRRLVDARTSINSVIARCQDKFEMKSYLLKHQIPMTPFARLGNPEDVDENSYLNGIIEEYGVPLVLKQRKSSGGRGVEVVATSKELLEQPIRKKVLSRNYIVEKFIPDTQEASVESFVVDGKIQFSNVTEYYIKRHVNIVPGFADADLTKKLIELNKKVIESLHIKWGLTHAEYYLTQHGILFGEIAIRPPGGHIMQLIEAAYGFDPWDAFCAVELELPFCFNQLANSVAAATIIHPGAGQIKRITGDAGVRDHPSTVSYSLKARVGLKIGSRLGSGNEIGHIIQKFSTRDETVKVLREVNSLFKISLV